MRRKETGSDQQRPPTDGLDRSHRLSQHRQRARGKARDPTPQRGALQGRTRVRVSGRALCAQRQGGLEVGRLCRQSRSENEGTEREASTAKEALCASGGVPVFAVAKRRQILRCRVRNRSTAAVDKPVEQRGTNAAKREPARPEATLLKA